MNFMRARRAPDRRRPASCRPSIRAGRTIAATSASAISILPERAYATDNSTDTFRLRSTNVIGKKVFSEFRFSVIDSTLSTSSLSTAAGDSRQRGVQRRRRRPDGRSQRPRDRDRAELRLLDRPQALDARGLLFESRLVGQQPALERVRHLHVHEPRRVQGRHCRRPTRSAPAIRSSTTRRSRPVGSCRTTSVRRRRCR